MYRAAFYDNAVLLQMRYRVVNRSLPFKTKIAVAGLDRQTRNFSRLYTRSVHIELLVTKSVGPTVRPLHKFGSYYFFVEFIGPVPVGDGNDAMVDVQTRRHRYLKPMRFGGQ